MKRHLATALVLLALSACAPVRPKPDASRVPAPKGKQNPSVPDLPYEKQLHWKGWGVWVRQTPNRAGDMFWYEVQVDRRKDGQEEMLYRNTFDADGPVRRTWLDDIFGTGWPVLAVFTSGGQKGPYGFLRLLECREKGFRFLSAPSTPRPLLEGFRGEDAWDWREGGLWREFPVYRPGDEPGKPTGGRRVIHYTKTKGKWRVQYRNDPPVPTPTPSILKK